MSECFIHKMIASRISYVNVHMKKTMEEQDFDDFEIAFLKPYKLDEFFMFLDVRDVNTDNIPPWFIEKILHVIHKQRPQRDKIKGIIFVTNSNAMVSFIKGLFTIYESDRPRFICSTDEEAAGWLTDRMLDLYGPETTMELVSNFASEIS